ncbi:MFS transporter [Cytobacillus gottheilii]|uniref:MFS transporter n=1 Tax=Cytobacillus gottheilii TaxID=859144 RepID=UPI0009BA7B09
MYMTSIKKTILTMQGFYLLTFFAVGSMMPLLSVYLSEAENLNGYQIGIIMSINPVVMIFFQPLWGMISDKTNSPIKILTFTTFIAGTLALGYLAFSGYSAIFFIAVLVAIFQSAIIPVSDSISISYTSKVQYNYGNIRLFGSLGFGLAVFIMGRLSEWNNQVIFISFFLALVLASILAWRMPSEKKKQKPNLLLGVKDILTMKKFLLFLLVTFLIFGPNLANNTYFGLFIEGSGGTYTGIGVAFLIAVLSEAPFMKAANGLIQRLGLLNIMLLASCVSLIRWVLYFTEPSLWIVYSTAVFQGISIGLFIPAALQYLREITPTHITATAITLYSAIGNGLGNWFCTFFGGIIFEEFSIFHVYLFYAILAALGVILTISLIQMQKTEQKKSIATTG